MTDLKWYHYPTQYAHLLEQTKTHGLRVLHSDGLYRHLRFAAPGTGMWHWDLITWPGSLAIRGDIGEGFIFTRDTDMLAFFDHGQPDGHINAGYWAEKLDRGSRSVRAFSGDKFRQWVHAYFDGGDYDGETVRRTLDDLGEFDDRSVDVAVMFLDDHGIDWNSDDPVSWEDYEYHFILALHAILWGAKKYHAEIARDGMTDHIPPTSESQCDTCGRILSCVGTCSKGCAQ